MKRINSFTKRIKKKLLIIQPEGKRTTEPLPKKQWGRVINLEECKLLRPINKLRGMQRRHQRPWI